jgi:hypothetical protein
MAELVAFAGARESLTFKATKLRAAEAKAIANDRALPPSYRAFVAHYGLFSVEHVNECLQMFAPEPVSSAYLGELDNPEADDAIAFQRADDDAVDNFFCFNPHVDLGGGELAVAAFYHDAPFALGRKKHPRDVGFAKHIVECIASFMKTYADEP